MCIAFLGSLDNSKSVGTNNLIKEFAKIVTVPEDIIMNYNFLQKNENGNLQIDDEFDDVSEEFKGIYKLIGKTPIDVDDIVRKSKINSKEVTSKLTMLELDGKIERTSGNRYVRKNK